MAKERNAMGNKNRTMSKTHHGRPFASDAQPTSISFLGVAFQQSFQMDRPCKGLLRVKIRRHQEQRTTLRRRWCCAHPTDVLARRCDGLQVSRWCGHGGALVVWVLHPAQTASQNEILKSVRVSELERVRLLCWKMIRVVVV